MSIPTCARVCRVYAVYMTSTLSGHRKPSRIVHVADARKCFTLCGHGIDASVMTTSPDFLPADCKRCLASLAKRDRAFQRKARGYLSKRGNYTGRQCPWAAPGCGRCLVCTSNRAKGSDSAARAIAAEEGRA